MFRKFFAVAVLTLGLGAAFSSFANATDANTVAETVVSGTFSGLSNHITTGGVSIVKTDAGYLAVLANDFSLDGAPSPTLGFGADGQFDAASEFTKLASNTGLQVYAIPASVNVADFNEIYVWCADVNVPLGVAKFSS